MDRCEHCGGGIAIGSWPFCKGGHGRGFATVISDSIPGGMVIEHMAETPLRFDSKSDWRREMKARRLMNRVEHRPQPGSDKSPHTQRWI